MKGIRRNVFIFALAMLSLCLLTGDGLAAVNKPNALIGGIASTTDDGTGLNGSVTLNGSISQVIYLDDSVMTADGETDIAGVYETIIDAAIGFTATRTNSGIVTDTDGTQYIDFDDATVSIIDGSCTHMTADLINIRFIYNPVDAKWELNPDLDSEVPSTLNLTNFQFTQGDCSSYPSRFIVELAENMDIASSSGLKLFLSFFFANIDANSYASVSGLLDGQPPVTDQLPVADAGDDVSITSEEVASTIITGYATDADGDPLLCRWKEGTDVLLNWTNPAGVGGDECLLDLNSSLIPLGIGEHTLTLEVSQDGGLTADASDDMVLIIVNSAPIADAGATSGSITCAGATCEITLDGSQSSDFDSSPGTNDDIVSFEWTGADPAFPLTGDVVTVTLPLGLHTITLTVTDSVGNTDSETIDVVIDPAALSLLDINKVMVKWNSGRVWIHGKVALPAGVSYLSVNSVGTAAISLADLGAVIYEDVDFIEHAGGKRWKYHDFLTTLGINRFKIDWHGAKFNYRKKHLSITSHHFGEDSTTIEITFCKKLSSPVDINIGDVTVSVDGNNAVTVVPDTTEIDVDYHRGRTEIEVVLPFAVVPDDVIHISGAINQDVTVGDYYTAAVGRFKILGTFDATGIDPTTLDPTLSLYMAIGDEQFDAQVDILPDVWTKITNTMWKYRARHH